MSHDQNSQSKFEQPASIASCHPILSASVLEKKQSALFSSQESFRILNSALFCLLKCLRLYKAKEVIIQVKSSKRFAGQWILGTWRHSLATRKPYYHRNSEQLKNIPVTSGIRNRAEMTRRTKPLSQRVDSLSQVSYLKAMHKSWRYITGICPPCINLQKQIIGQDC